MYQYLLFRHLRLFALSFSYISSFLNSYSSISTFYLKIISSLLLLHIFLLSFPPLHFLLYFFFLPFSYFPSNLQSNLICSPFLEFHFHFFLHQLSFPPSPHSLIAFFLSLPDFSPLSLSPSLLHSFPTYYFSAFPTLCFLSLVLTLTLLLLSSTPFLLRFMPRNGKRKSIRLLLLLFYQSRNEWYYSHLSV